MANLRISQLAAAAAIAGDELLLVSQLSASVRVSGTNISASATDNSFNDAGGRFVAQGFAVGDQVGVTGFSDAATNLVSGTVTAVAAGKLTIGGADGDAISDVASGDLVVIAKWESRRARVDIFVGGSAATTPYANGGSGLSGTTVQTAIDEIAGAISSGGANVGPDSHPVSPAAADDEFELGASVDLAGARRVGAEPWVWVNQGTTTADLAQGHLVMRSPADAANANRLLLQSAAGLGKWRGKLATFDGANTNFRWAGVVARNSSTGAFLLLKKSYATGNKLEVELWSSPSAFSANRLTTDIYTAAFGRAARAPIYLEMEVSDTHVRCRYSDVGVDGSFILASSEPIGSLGVVDQVGLCVGTVNGVSAVAVWDWWRQVA